MECFDDPIGRRRRSRFSYEELEGLPFRETQWWNRSEELQEPLDSWIAWAAEEEYIQYKARHHAPDGANVMVDGVLPPIIDADRRRFDH